MPPPRVIKKPQEQITSPGLWFHRQQHWVQQVYITKVAYSLIDLILWGRWGRSMWSKVDTHFCVQGTGVRNEAMSTKTKSLIGVLKPVSQLNSRRDWAWPSHWGKKTQPKILYLGELLCWFKRISHSRGMDVSYERKLQHSSGWWFKEAITSQLWSAK